MNFYDGNYLLLGSIAFTLAAALLFGVCAFIALDTLWRLRRDPAPSNLGSLLARHGLDWGRVAAVGSTGEVSIAFDRCAECRARQRCDEWLASGSRTGYERFCPNARFVERLAAAAQR